MSVKHVKEYFDKMCDDYSEMLETIHDLEEAVSENIVSEERLKEVQSSLEIIKTNYMRWSYMMYLLNMPNKKEKQKVYEKRMQDFQKKIPAKDTFEGTRQENKEALKQFKSDINSIRE